MSDKHIVRIDHYRLLGRSGLRVSPLCLGSMTFGTDWGWGADKKASRKIFDAYAGRGGNFIDTANFYTYGKSESYIADFIAPNRDHFVLATKYTFNKQHGNPNAGGNHRKNMVRSLEASLQRLKTDYVDLFYLHAWDYTTPVEEIMRAFDDLIRAGKILHVAISNTPAWKIAQANTLAELRGWSPIVALQVEYSLAARDAERELTAMSKDLGIAVLPWAPLAGGVLTGKYTEDDLRRQQAGEDMKWFGQSHRAVLLTEKRLQIVEVLQTVASELGCTPGQVALRWLFTRNGVVSVVCGARTRDQIEENIAALEIDLDATVLEQLDRVSAIEYGSPHDDICSCEVRDLISGGTVTVYNTDPCVCA